jgi:hypothetical protein
LQLLYCNAVYDTQHGLNIHLARWCREATRECYTEEFPVDRILQARARGPPEYRYYQVLWAGYTKAECEEMPWEPARHLLDCAALDEYWANAEAQNTDHLPEQAGEHRCKWCCKFYKTHAALKGHWTRKIGGCDSKPRSKAGTRAEKAVNKAKMVKIHKAADKVLLNGKELKNSFNFRYHWYLGFVFQADGGWRHAVDVRMALARARFGKMHHIWSSNILSMEVKLQLYSCAVVSVLVYGSEAWTLTAGLTKALNGWNSRCLHIITGRSYREEAMDPSYNLVSKIRAKRLRWVGHVLREEESHLVRRVLVGYINEKVDKYPEGSILMDAPKHSSAEELIEAASDKADWNISVNAVDWKPKANPKHICGCECEC